MVRLRDDLRSAWQLLRRRRGFAFAVSLTIAAASGFLGVAASVAISLLGASAMPAYHDAVRPVAIVLLVAGGMVVFAAASNLATLSMSSYAARVKEFAIRESIGGTQPRLMRQLYLEGMVLAAIACVLGAIFAGWSRQIVLAWFSPEQAAIAASGDSIHVPVFAGLVVFLVCAVVCLICARFGCELGLPLPGGRRDDLSGAARASRPQRAVVGVQIGCACTVLTGGALLTAAMHDALRIGPGHLADRVAVVEAVTAARYADFERGRAFHLAALEQVARMPGVVSVAWTSTLPLVSASRGGYSVDRSVQVPYRTVVVSSNYFKTMAHEVLLGREFNADDDRVDRGVIVVNRALAQREFPAGAVGREIRSEFGRHTIVGVVGDARFRRFEEPVEPAVFMPMSSRYLAGMQLVARTTVDAGPFADDIARVLQSIDGPEIRRKTTLDGHLRSALRRDRVTMVVVFAAIALAMAFAIVGPYLLTRQVVLSRRAELAVRMALGAGGATLVRLVLAQTVRATGLGIAGGIAAATAIAIVSSGMTRLTMVELLMTLAVTAASVAVVSMVAALIPATEAACVHPATSLR